MIQDPYIFENLFPQPLKTEKSLEDAIIDDIEAFLLNMGNGFAFLERQKIIEVDGEHFKIDLLFFHRKLRRIIAIFEDLVRLLLHTTTNTDDERTILCKLILRFSFIHKRIFYFHQESFCFISNRCIRFIKIPDNFKIHIIELFQNCFEYLTNTKHPMFQIQSISQVKSPRQIITKQEAEVSQKSDINRSEVVLNEKINLNTKENNEFEKADLLYRMGKANYKLLFFPLNQFSNQRQLHYEAAFSLFSQANAIYKRLVFSASINEYCEVKINKRLTKLKNSGATSSVDQETSLVLIKKDQSEKESLEGKYSPNSLSYLFYR